MDWICPDRDASCLEAALCERCYGRELTSKRRQAEVIGQCWAERVCRGELRQRAVWPLGELRTLAIARRLVGSLARDPRLLDELVRACDSGASAWWSRRPEHYR